MTLLLFLTVTPHLQGETRNPPKFLVSAKNREIGLRFHLCSSGWKEMLADICSIRSSDLQYKVVQDVSFLFSFPFLSLCCCI